MAAVPAGDKVVASVSGTSVVVAVLVMLAAVGVSVLLIAVDVSITGVDDASGVGVASCEEGAVETAGGLEVDVGSAGIEVGTTGRNIEGNFKLPPVINRTRITAKTSKLPALKTKPFGLVGKKRKAINVRIPNKLAHAKLTKKTITPFGHMPATPLPKPKPPALSGRKSS